jgi:hypothetical protein
LTSPSSTPPESGIRTTPSSGLRRKAFSMCSRTKSMLLCVISGLPTMLSASSPLLLHMAMPVGAHHRDGGVRYYDLAAMVVGRKRMSGAERRFAVRYGNESTRLDLTSRHLEIERGLIEIPESEIGPVVWTATEGGES